jgi:hypothetical protein
MSKIEIPFRKDMAEAVVEGYKFCTSRNKPCGIPGDIFRVETETGDWIECELMGIVQLPLFYVSYVLYELEGFDTCDEFEEAWEEIHPRAKWTPEKLVWVHFFRRIYEDSSSNA